jgi:mannosyl-3-phosphoglycerate synthase
MPVVERSVAEKGVEIVQTETVNPHLHEERGDTEHLYGAMLLPSLSVIYHSPVCEESTRQLIRDQLKEVECLKNGEEVPRVTLLPPPQKASITVFTDELGSQLGEISVPRGWLLGQKLSQAKASVPARKVVYTDLDGTLLHPSSYSYAPALTALRRLQEAQVPVVFCSAKTLAEQEELRRELGVKDPFIVENGGAIYIPKDYFHFPLTYTRATAEYFIIELGSPYAEIKQRLKLVNESNPQRFTTFGDLSVEEVARVSGLTLKMAELAKQRDYSETLILPGDKREAEAILAGIASQGMQYVFGGRFYEVSRGADKGKAVKILNELFKLNFGHIQNFGLGDGQNDAPMLEAVDCPLLVQNSTRRWSNVKVKKLVKIKEVGPEGWSRAVSEWVLR